MSHNDETTYTLLSDQSSCLDHVPPEILSEVFVACLPHGRHSQSSLHPQSIPVVLCNVSHTWKAVALAIPKLWTDLIVEVEGDASLEPHKLPKVVREWFSKAGQNTVSLTIRTTGSTSRTNESHATSIFPEGLEDPATQPLSRLESSASINVLCQSPFMHQVDNLSLELQSFHSFQYLPPGSFPSISSLVVRYNPFVPATAIERTISVLSCFDESPSLRRACFYDYIPMTLPWSQLTHLVMCFAVSSSFYASVIASCVNLQTLVLIERMTPARQLMMPPVASPAPLPNLQHLEIAIFLQPENDGPDDPVLYPTIFRFCSLPALKALRILTSQKPGAFNPANWPSAWKRAFYDNLRPVERLTLNIHPLNAGDYRDLFKAACNTEVLALELYNSLDQMQTIHDVLCESNSETADPLLPKLTAVRCRAPTLDDDFSFIIQDDFLIRFVNARERNPRCKTIQEVVLTSAEPNVINNSETRSNVLRYFENSISRGLKVSFETATRVWYDGVIFSNDWSEAPGLTLDS